ncbi:hypothetical protein GTA08_BOTSDO09057 [Neofusicoccum parvum]|nr:hypothetical protein GTA08_BOTSDO09057 [Neofusicoccum parvum]
MPPLIRRRPLSERIKAYLDPYDWLLWLSEEINGNDLDEALKDWVYPIGVAVNLVFMVARANSGGESYEGSDDVFGDYTARAARDVWEISVWDPKPTCLRLFCLFSPGHILVYWIFLPLAPLDPRPSVTVVTTMVLGVLMTTQLSMLRSYSSQQAKDAALINREVLHEYDTKFVHPTLNKPMRNVGTQTPNEESQGTSTREVDTYTPTTVINRGFRTNPNPAYASQYDPDGALQSEQRLPRSAMPNPFMTPRLANAQPPAAGTPGSRRATSMRQPVFRPTSDTGAGDGGSLGVYSHAASPLRKSQSVNFMRPDEVERKASPEKRGGSPLKRMSTPGDWGKVPGLERQRRPYQAGFESARRETGRY